MFYTGIDPFSKQEVYVARTRNRKVQRALLQFFNPENYFDRGERRADGGREKDEERNNWEVTCRQM